jgi:hypothetical protein
MAPPELTVTTIRYLYATTWLPYDPKERTIAVPGGETTALDTAANLLHTALWNLHRQGAIDFHQVRPVEKENVRVLGGRSFARFEFRDPGVELRGLEGAVLRAARAVEPHEGLIDKGIEKVTDEEPFGMRRLVRAMNLRHQAPWTTVTDHCLVEAAAAGLVERKGWLIKSVVITDPPAIESLRERNDELRAARKADMERDFDVHHAVIADCLYAVNDALGLAD